MPRYGQPLNRTSVELKHFLYDAVMDEAPRSQSNQCGIETVISLTNAQAHLCTLNRTSVELKHVAYNDAGLIQTVSQSNQCGIETIMVQSIYQNRPCLSIEPVWN